MASHRVAIQTYVLALAVVLVVAAVSGGFLLFRGYTGEKACDVALLAHIGATGSGLCLQPLRRVISKSNSSDFEVPALIMKAGATASVEIMYNLSEGIYVSRSYEKPNVTSSDAPLTLSVTTARPSPNSVSFSNGVLLFRDAGWAIYSYSVTASDNSSGYYAILPTYYYGMNPALIVGASPNGLNMTSLAMWGYTGFTESGEAILPSTIVGTSGMTVLEVSVPMTNVCPNSACIFIAHSLY